MQTDQLEELAKLALLDRRARDRLLVAARPTIMDIATSVLGVGPDAEDVTQIVLDIVDRHFDDFRGESKFSTWLHRIALNRSIDRWRKIRRERRARTSEDWEELLDRVAAAGDAEAAVVEGMTRAAALRAALAALTPARREAVELHWRDGYTIVEAAAHLGMKEVTFKLRLSDAKRDIAKTLRRLLGDTWPSWLAILLGALFPDASDGPAPSTVRPPTDPPPFGAASAISTTAAPTPPSLSRRARLAMGLGTLVAALSVILTRTVHERTDQRETQQADAHHVGPSRRARFLTSPTTQPAPSSPLQSVAPDVHLVDWQTFDSMTQHMLVPVVAWSDSIATTPLPMLVLGDISIQTDSLIDIGFYTSHDVAVYGMTGLEEPPTIVGAGFAGHEWAIRFERYLAVGQLLNGGLALVGNVYEY
jgi:RNA polymerase sigma-70 factor (ECF subfamily)